jgi:hypothetical protein
MRYNYDENLEMTTMQTTEKEHVPVSTGLTVKTNHQKGTLISLL